MTKRVIGVSLSVDMVGVAGCDGLIGQRTIGLAKKAGALQLDTLLNLKEYFDKTFSSPARKYNMVAVVSGEYAINVKGFSEADMHAKMIGALSLIAAEHGIRTCEVPQSQVSELATGKRKGTLEDYRVAAVRSGIRVNGPYAAEAYWIMCLASKE